MSDEKHREENRRNTGITAFGAAVLGVILLAAGILGGYMAGKHHVPPPPESIIVPAADSSSSSAPEPFSVEEIEEVTPEALTESEEQLAEELQGIVGAVIPNVGAYAAHMHGRGHIVCIDPGHQNHGMSEGEPVGPGSSEMKAKLTTGTQGTATGKTEYEINLEIGLILKDVLTDRGYRTVMTRETNDVNISNAERALLARDAGAEVFIRLHCNGSDNSGTRGVLAYQPTFSNPYLPAEVIEGSQVLAKLVLEHQAAATGQNSLGLIPGDDMTGINWASMPVVIIEMGYMSNPDEDRFLADPEGQKKIAEGIADGIDAFFNGE